MCFYHTNKKMKKFDIPEAYQSNIIKKIKQYRKINDPKKKDFSPTRLNFESLEIVLARHFGFCYGVENAIEISYKAVQENKGKKIYLLSQMIHNPHVNADLNSNGIDFILDTEGNNIISWDKISKNDVVIIPAFGTTLEIENLLKEKEVDIKTYNTTCPFVEKVWKTSQKIGEKNFSIVIHGKHNHEETRATFSHANQNAPSIIVKNIEEAKILCLYILEKISLHEFNQIFKGKYSNNFIPNIHLNKVGVINQTTMLASETHEISELIKNTLIQKFGIENISEHFADTRDTLCYATNDNQDSTLELLKEKHVDYALVVGGYNSSNTSHLVELCESKFKTFFISSADDIKTNGEIANFNIHTNEIKHSKFELSRNTFQKIIITSGASCPDSILEEIILKLFSLKNISKETLNLEGFVS